MRDATSYHCATVNMGAARLASLYASLERAASGDARTLAARDLVREIRTIERALAAIREIVKTEKAR